MDYDIEREKAKSAEVRKLFAEMFPLCSSDELPWAICHIKDFIRKRIEFEKREQTDQFVQSISRVLCEVTRPKTHMIDMVRIVVEEVKESRMNKEKFEKESRRNKEKFELAKELEKERDELLGVVRGIGLDVGCSHTDTPDGRMKLSQCVREVIDKAEEQEKKRRVYYQDIVYSVCNQLDRAFGRRTTRGEGVASGTVENPSTQVQQLAREMADRSLCWTKHLYEIENNSAMCHTPSMPVDEEQAKLNAQVRDEQIRWLREWVNGPFGQMDDAKVKRAVRCLFDEFDRKDKFVCGARKQGAAGGNDPADCNWPYCGCDPVANKVLEAVEETGRLIQAKQELKDES